MKVMKNTFNVNDKFKHENGFTWVITGIFGKNIEMQSEHEGQITKGQMTQKDLAIVIKMGYYTPIA